MNFCAFLNNFFLIKSSIILILPILHVKCPLNINRPPHLEELGLISRMLALGKWAYLTNTISTCIALVSLLPFPFCFLLRTLAL